MANKKKSTSKKSDTAKKNTTKTVVKEKKITVVETVKEEKRRKYVSDEGIDRASVKEDAKEMMNDLFGNQYSTLMLYYSVLLS